MTFRLDVLPITESGALRSPIITGLLPISPFNPVNVCFKYWGARRMGDYMLWRLMWCVTCSLLLLAPRKSLPSCAVLCLLDYGSPAATAQCPAPPCFQWPQASRAYARSCHHSKTGKTEASPLGSHPNSQNTGHMVQSCLSLPGRSWGLSVLSHPVVLCPGRAYTERILQTSLSASIRLISC